MSLKHPIEKGTHFEYKEDDFIAAVVVQEVETPNDMCWYKLKVLHVSHTHFSNAKDKPKTLNVTAPIGLPQGNAFAWRGFKCGSYIPITYLETEEVLNTAPVSWMSILTEEYCK